MSWDLELGRKPRSKNCATCLYLLVAGHSFALRPSLFCDLGQQGRCDPEHRDAAGGHHSVSSLDTRS
jgi:hypothetical protein